MRDPTLYLLDMVEAIDRILLIRTDCDRKRFLHDFLPRDAILRNLEVLGEAARNVSDEIRDEFVQVEWRKLIAFRNIISHEYFGVDYELVWDVVENKLEPLRQILLEYLD
ncbi:DUF86 domain-containing protein [bacterium]|nr:DUF86 domain-containing protein [bacterium]